MTSLVTKGKTYQSKLTNSYLNAIIQHSIPLNHAGNFSAWFYFELPTVAVDAITNSYSKVITFLMRFDAVLALVVFGLV